MSGNLHFLLLLKLISVLTKKTHVFSTNNVKLRAKNSKISNGFPTSFLREKCKEDKGMLAASFRSNPFKNELD